MSRVLVTGGSGFIGCHAIIQLLAGGHKVHTTVRNLSKADDVRKMLRIGGLDLEDGNQDLSFFKADLYEDLGWLDAAKGCDYVLHIASPFPASEPRNDDDLIVPARDGAIRVLRAARDAGVKRVVLTSSFAAIGYGSPPVNRPFDERDWTNPNASGVSAYAKSKTIAERAAWDFIEHEGRGLELAVVNPVGVFGPVLGADYSTSILLVQRLMEGSVPGCPKLYFGIVDVRDVADLHIRAMSHPAAQGERFLAVAGDFMSVAEIAKTIKVSVGAAGSSIKTREIPNWLVRLAALRDPALRLITSELGQRKAAYGRKAREMLGWTPLSNHDALLATARSLIGLGLVSHSGKRRIP